MSLTSSVYFVSCEEETVVLENVKLECRREIECQVPFNDATIKGKHFLTCSKFFVVGIKSNIIDLAMLILLIAKLFKN